MTIIRSADRLKSFNKRSNQMKDSALKNEMTISKEWIVDGFECFMAFQPNQGLVKIGLSMAECGACINNNPRVWWLPPGSGRIEEYVYLDKKVK